MTAKPVDVLRRIMGQRLEEFRAYRYASGGAECGEVVMASHAVFSARAREVERSAMETHRLTVEAVRCSAHITPRGYLDVVPLRFPVDRVELFHRDEWTEPYDEPGSTIGSNPVVVRTGPVGSGLTGVQAVTVLCGIAIHAAAPSPRSILIYLADYPGLISWTCDPSEIAVYRHGVTAEDLPNGSGLPRF
jgi:hypothetical protein